MKPYFFFHGSDSKAEINEDKNLIVTQSYSFPSKWLCDQLTQTHECLKEWKNFFQSLTL